MDDNINLPDDIENKPNLELRWANEKSTQTDRLFIFRNSVFGNFTDGSSVHRFTNP